MSIKKEFIVAIPARLESSRLPRKVLEDIGGKPMIKIVLEICAYAERAIKRYSTVYLGGKCSWPFGQ